MRINGGREHTIKKNFKHNILSNIAPYMVKAGTVLKNLYTKIIHTTCRAHALYQIAEEI